MAMVTNPGWRGTAAGVIRWPLTRLIIAVVWVGVWLFVPRALHIDSAIARAVVASILVVAAYVIFVRVVERRPVRELGTQRMARELVEGLLLGALLFSATIGIIWALGGYSIVGVRPWTAILPPLATAIVSGITEEILFRGIVFRIVEEGLGSWIALAISSLVFGGAHLANPNASVMSSIAIALEAGVLLGGAFMVTRRLWLPIGLHAAWNFTQAGIFGTTESGIDLGGLLHSKLSGPAWVTGGTFGPEASIPAVLVALVAGSWVIVLAVRAGHIVPPYWRRAPSFVGERAERPGR
ncbi:MAG: type II CAAX endopeptidase family protein [Gemmatimonadaceae bacterium]